MRLEALKADADIQVLTQWIAHAAAWRLLDAVSIRPRLPKNNGLEAEDRPKQFYYLIYPLNGDRPRGHVGLFGIDWTAGTAWLDIGLGDRSPWGDGCGADALQVILRWGFDELDLGCILIGVFDYDARAILAYEEAGFAIRGRILQEAGRAGQSRAGMYLGLRRGEWDRIVKRET